GRLGGQCHLLFLLTATDLARHFPAVKENELCNFDLEFQLFMRFWLSLSVTRMQGLQIGRRFADRMVLGARRQASRQLISARRTMFDGASTFRGRRRLRASGEIEFF